MRRGLLFFFLRAPSRFPSRPSWLLFSHSSQGPPTPTLPRCTGGGGKGGDVTAKARRARRTDAKKYAGFSSRCFAFPFASSVVAVHAPHSGPLPRVHGGGGRRPEPPPQPSPGVPGEGVKGAG